MSIHIGGDADHNILVTGSQNVVWQAGQVLVRAAEQARRAQRDPARMLRVLAVLAAPVFDPARLDRTPPPLDLKQEWHTLAQEVRKSHAPILLARLTPPTLDALRAALSPRAGVQELFPHILHFSGHAWAGGLLLEDELGQVHRVTTDEVLDALRSLPRPLDLVVLNGCETAADEVRSVAQALVEGGLARAAVGHPYPVLDLQAVAFAGRLYAELTNGFPLREAVDRARKAITTQPVVLLDDERLSFKDYLSPGQAVIDDRRPRGKIPPRGAFFFGRGRELVEIARHLAHPSKIIVVSGPEGIGKTGLLIEATHRNAWRFPGGVAYAEGTAEETRLGTATALLLQLAAGLGVEAMPENVEEKLKQHLALAPTLLLLDNLESLPRSEQEALARFLRWLGDGNAALLARGSPSAALENLPAAVPFPLHEGLAMEPAIRYALALAGQRSICLNKEQAREVAEATGGHPRLIELVLDHRVRDRDALLAEVRKRKGSFAAQLQLVRTWRGEAMPLADLPPMIEVFIGREREKNEFRRALEGVLRMTEADKDADWAQVFFIWGEGGMGKSTLLGEYVKMCEAYADQLFWLYVDWESTGVTSQSGTFGMMRLIKERLTKKYQVDFSNFRAIESERLRVLRKIEAIRPRFTGDSQEQFKRFVEAHLSERDYSLFYDRRESQRRLSEAFVSDLNQLATKRPVVLMFDSYETVWHFADEWVRGGLFHYCLGNPEVGRRFIIVIAGRLPEEVETRHRDDARRYIRPLAYFHKALDKFTEDDIQDFLSQVVPDRPLSNSLVSRIHTITRGIPLAVNEMAAIIRTEGNIEQIFGDIREPLADRQVLPLITQRFLKHLSQQTPQGIRDRDCIYTFAVVRESKTSESGRSITRREKFLRDIWFRCRLVSSSEEFYRIKQHLRERYSFLFPGGNMHPDVRFFVRKALHQAIIEPGKLVEINEAAKTICELKLKERVKKLEARYGPERAAREKYRDSLWQEWLLDLVNHLLWLQEYDDAIEIIINEYVMAIQYGSEGFHRRLLSLLRDDELLYDALPARHKELIERLSNLREWAGRLTMDAERERLLELLRDEARLAGLLLTARAATDAGEFEAARRRIVEAEQLYRAGEQVDRAFESDLAAAYHLLGRRLARSSRRRQVQQDSLDLLKKAQDWSPNDPHIRCALGKVFVNLGLLELAKREFETALRLSGGTSREAREGLNRVEHLEKLRHFHPRKQARILTVEGNALSARGEFDEAKRLFKAAMRSDPSYIPAHVKLSHLLRYEGDAEKALSLLDEINIAEISETYLQATVYDAYGAVFLALEQFDRAIEAYQTAIELSPEYINPLNGLGRTYVRLGKGQEAIEMFEWALKVKRRGPVSLRTSLFWVYNGLGMAYLLVNQPNGAMESFQFAELLCERHLDRKSLRYYTLANLGIALLGQHRYEESLDAFKRFAKTSKPRGLIQELLADIQLIGKYGKTTGWQQVAAFVTSLL